jgi:hypothetical protein
LQITFTIPYISFVFDLGLGYSVFATKDFNEGDFLLEIQGHAVLQEDPFDVITKQLDIPGTYTFKSQGNTYV